MTFVNGQLINLFPVAVGNLDAGLKVPASIHEPPFVFPLLVLGVELHFPRFIERLEPKFTVRVPINTAKRV